ncbi:DEKNAAC104012 [Brettanomyces naardenensis]|uniref:DEKNAAC104012 n=1 Tax=Brettanomyces naardenensis TaxID=13370 RepID=A0A448YPV1_BRENA|nr:DEKNAAC104012 [Brettanomyces naardenensis]
MQSEEPDYYSEDVPGPEDETEILESEPTTEKKTIEVMGNLLGGVEGESNNKEEEGGNEYIDNTEVVTIESRSAFENQLIRSIDKIDFERNRGYKVEEVRNSRAQKLARIRNELREVELGDEGSAQEKAEINELKQRLERLTVGRPAGENEFIKVWKKRVRELMKVEDDLVVEGKKEEGKKEEEKEEEGEKEEEKEEGKKKSIRVSPTAPGISVIELESRLKDLESRVGDISKEDSLTLQDEVTDLYRKIGLLLGSEGSLEEVKAQLSSLSENLEEYTKRSRRLGDGEVEQIVPLTDQRINRVYKRLERMPEFERVVPLMLKRLQAINNLVTESSGAVSFLGNLQGEFDRMDMQIDEWNKKMDEVEGRMKKDREMWESLSSRLPNETR